jgi:hypothetical protein
MSGQRQYRLPAASGGGEGLTSHSAYRGTAGLGQKAA